MPLTADQIRDLSRLLDEALALPVDEREAWLAALPAARQALVEPLRRMLAQSGADTEGSLLATLPQLDGLAADAGDSTPAEAAEGERVGPYRLRQVIGRGGMGAVWLADRVDGIFEREVAVKMPRLSRHPGLADRMARERQIGALLEHPHIARLYDAGIDALGRPYLVMERVQGVNLIAHCDREGLDLRQRLGLMLQTCAALAHAHRLLVVHRDIKPSNLLVDHGGQVKLLDFGIARLLDIDGPMTNSLSDGSQRTHTPRYAAPEQRQGDPVSTAADIYSLGVVLHEMLTGTLPDAPADQLKAGRAGLDRDLRAVLRRALRDNPDERYSSVERLGDDLRRVLSGHPVTAEPAAPWHRAALFARRHSLALGAAAVVLGLMGSSAALYASQQTRTRVQADRAAQAREFLFDLFEDAEPLDGQTGAEVTGVRMAQAALARARLGFASQPDLRAQVLVELGVLFRRFQQPAEAESILREGLALLERHAERDDPALQIARAQLALQLLVSPSAERSKEADDLAGQALAGCPATSARCAKARAYAYSAWMLSANARGDTDAMVVNGRHAVREHDAAFGPRHAESAMARLHLAIMLRSTGALREAAEALDQAMATAAQVPMRAADAQHLRLNQALSLADLGRHQDAVSSLQVLSVAEGGAPLGALVRRLLSQSMYALGRFEQALINADEALATARDDEPGSERLFARQARARALSALGRHTEALADMEAVRTGLVRLGLAPGSVSLLRARRISGEVALRAGRIAEARALLDPVPAAHRGSDPAHPVAPVDLALALDLLGALERQAGAAATARTRHAEARSLLAAALPEPHPLRRRNALEAALAEARLPGAAPSAAADAARKYLELLPADSAWRPMVNALAADPAAAAPWVL
ncbi:serine/threonine-protein kinase [Ideonella sp. A 288]|uniref:serine/threonine-protein kinase n=1 Tax=Ideonella sp. A 288 TaxID=1962181 RepID=UPI000B4A5F10|nr:serine/threonine-protein kinase [Ideonella sp. A 288]